MILICQLPCRPIAGSFAAAKVITAVSLRQLVVSSLRRASRGGSILRGFPVPQWDWDGDQSAASSARRATQDPNRLPGFRTHLRDVQDGLMHHSQ